ncbi:MAG TPA: DUF998 domain-containing protein [Thermoplasmata archaeon]|nr:DUF998 domain-containing protein [Thermoplasmata archaeon]
MRYDDRTLAGVLFFFGSVEFLLAMLVSEGSLPTYVVSSQPISDLGVGPTAALFNTSIVLLGLLTLAGAYFYHRTHKTLWITVPFLLAGIGPIGVGLFPENLPENIRFLHGLFALISFLFGGLVAILIATRVRPPFRYISLLLGVLGLVALALFLAGQDAGIGYGGMERMIAYPVLFWEVGFGGYLMSSPEGEPVPGARKDTGA